VAPETLPGATSPLRVMSDFLVTGRPRCRTTSLFNHPVEHPGVLPTSRQEARYFRNRSLVRGRLWCRSHFPIALYQRYARWVRRRVCVTGEAAPYYIFHPLSPERARETVPQAKLIPLLSNPVDRAYSQYNHELRRGAETLPFESAIERKEERLRGERGKMLRDESHHSFSYLHHSYLSRGVYVDQLMAWRNFPEEQLLVLKSEDLFADPAAVVERTLDSLGVPDREPREYGRLNEGRYVGMDPALRERLVECFRPQNQKLYEYPGTNLGWWDR
jgi:hypothetical protein